MNYLWKLSPQSCSYEVRNIHVEKQQTSPAVPRNPVKMDGLFDEKPLLWKGDSVEDFVIKCELSTKGDNYEDNSVERDTQLKESLVKIIQDRKYSELRILMKSQPSISAVLSEKAFQADILNECVGLQARFPEDFPELANLISEFPITISTPLFNGIFPLVRDKNHLNLISMSLRKSSPMDLQTWKNVFTEVLIHHLPEREEENSWPILNQPILILENFIINREFTVLKACLGDLKSQSLLVMEKCGKCSSYEFLTDLAEFPVDHQDLPFTEGCLNKLLLFYAEYSVQVPKVEATPKECFVKPQIGFNIVDEKAEICMCCLRVKFTTPKGRHPCLRCKKIVPGAMKSVPSRVCKDCSKWANSFSAMVKRRRAEISIYSMELKAVNQDTPHWNLTGNKSADTELRLKFSFTSIPDAELCLSLLDLCTDDEAYNQFLVKQCEKYEDLMGPARSKPGNEKYLVDFAKLAKILKCFALAAKVRGSCELNWDLVIARTEIIKKLVKLDREDLIPRENWNARESMKRWRNNLMNADLFPIAFDLSIMCGFSTYRVLQAWGIHCIKVENYFLAREKISHSQSRLISVTQADRIARALIDNRYPKDQLQGIVVQRPKESPQIVVEVLKVLEEKYDVEWEQESLYYLFLFGSHRDILSFLMRNRRWALAFPYILDHNLDFDDFLDAVILNAAVEMSEFELVVLMRGSNPSLEKWDPYLSKLCALYEKKNVLENLYNLQTSIQDDIRAALTCIKFFSNNCSNYRCFLQHGNYLAQAEFHLKRELKRQAMIPAAPSQQSIYSNRSSKLILDPKKIEHHLKKIELQRKITQFLVPFEDPFCGTNLLKIVENCSENRIETPLTIFDHRHLRYLLYLIVSCDEKRGYELLQDILSTFPSMDQRSLYQFLIDAMFRHAPVEKTIEFAEEVRIRSLRGHLVDYCILQAIKRSQKESGKSRKELQQLINTIQNIHLRINAFIESDHLKTAYLLAVESKDYDQLRRIAAQADSTNPIKRLCDKHLTRYKS